MYDKPLQITLHLLSDCALSITQKWLYSGTSLKGHSEIRTLCLIGTLDLDQTYTINTYYSPPTSQLFWSQGCLYVLETFHHTQCP